MQFFFSSILAVFIVEERRETFVGLRPVNDVISGMINCGFHISEK